MTAGAGRARRIIGKIAGAYGNRMGMARMERIKGIRMTGGTVAAYRKGLADCRTEQRTGGGVMAAGACVMNLRITWIYQRRRICMTAGTAGCSDVHQGIMRRSRGMQGLPGTHMTAGTVGRVRVAYSRTDKRTGACIMTARTGIMRIGGCTYQGIIVAAGAGGRTNRDARMAGIIRMHGRPGASMAGGTVAAYCKALADG